MGNADQKKDIPAAAEQKKELGLMESYGSFPVWSLKLIDVLIPKFLVSKGPVKKKKLPQ